MKNKISLIFGNTLKARLALFVAYLILTPFKIDANNYPINTSSKRDKGIIVIHYPEQQHSEKEALIILPGFGDSKKARKHQKRYFENAGYDLYIPDIIDKSSFDSSIDNFAHFFEKQNLRTYRKVHVFSYILGGWIINSFINENGKGNIQTIIYDRSPLQERAPMVVVERIPKIGKWRVGEILKEFSTISYPPIAEDGIKIGIIVECKATNLIRMFRKTTMSYGPIDWNNLDFHQGHKDLIFTRLNHDQMYCSFEEIGPDIIHFIETGVFTTSARRDPFNWDPFKKYRSIRQ